jgi:putative ABC transport system substrate-binding protein
MLYALAVLIALAAPAAVAAEGKIARIGRVYTGAPSTTTRGFGAFTDRLRELGWIEGRNLVIESRWAEGRDERFPALIRELIERKVDVIVITGSAGAVAAKQTTSTVPIVVAGMGDPLESGLAQTLARPGGNLTGFSVQNAEGMPGKWLELVKGSVPGVAEVAVLLTPSNPLAAVYEKRFREAASVQGLNIRFLPIARVEELERVFRQAREEAQAAVVIPEAFTMYHRNKITGLAAKYRLPTIYGLLEFADVGGLMAYGVDMNVVWQGTATYVDKILRGARPAEMPIEQPTQFYLAVNLKTAKALGLTIPQPILLRADQVIR